MTADSVHPLPGPTPSGSTVAYLFADRFVSTVKREVDMKYGMKAFGTGQVVVTRELAAGLVAIGLWQLREQGVVTLEGYKRRKLSMVAVNIPRALFVDLNWAPVSGVRVRLVGVADDGGGVEKRLIEHLERRTSAQRLEGLAGRVRLRTRAITELVNTTNPRVGGETAWDIARRISSRGVISKAIDEAVSLGYLERGSELCPHMDRISALDGDAEKLASAWRDFWESEPELANLLRKTTLKGIEASASSGGSGGDSDDGSSIFDLLPSDSSSTDWSYN